MKESSGDPNVLNFCLFMRLNKDSTTSYIFEPIKIYICFLQFRAFLIFFSELLSGLADFLLFFK